MKHPRTPRDLFFDQLLDLQSTEDQLGRALPELAATAVHGGLRELLERHSGETERHHLKITGILKRHSQASGSDRSKAIAGLIKGGRTHLQAAANVRTRDLMMIAHCLRIEYYEIAAYRIAARLAERLGYADEGCTLRVLLAEEERSAESLMELEPEVFRLAGHADDE